MSRRNTALAFASLIASAILGAWLTGMFEGEKKAEDISGLTLLLGVLGFFIFLGSLIGILLLIRQNLRPMSQREMLAWETIREKGKRSYIRNAIVRGFILGLISITWPLISDYWKVKSFGSIINSLWIHVALFLVVIFASYYAAIRTWDANEKDYEVLIQSTPQPNNLFNPTTR